MTMANEEPEGGESRASVAGVLPGPDLILLLATRELADTDDHELIERVKAWERLASWVAAAQINTLTEFARRRPADPARPLDQSGHLDVDEFAADEIALALTLSPLTAQRRLRMAVGVSERLPRALDALAQGRIDPTRLATLHDETQDLPDDRAEALAREMLDAHDRTPLTNGQIKHRVRKRVIRERSTAENEKAQREAARQRQGIDLLDLGEGAAELRARLSSRDGAVAMAILDSAAHQARTPGDTRTLGQRRIAALMDLLTGRTRAGAGPGTGDGAGDGGSEAVDDGASAPASTSRAGTTTRTTVDTSIPYSEFLRLADHFGLTLLGRAAPAPGTGSPGEVDSLGAVPGWVVRDLVSDVLTTPGTGFRAVIYDDTTGQLKGMSSTRYIPPKAMADHVRHHDITCRFPGCRRTARRCDIDHAHPWNHGGITENCKQPPRQWFPVPVRIRVPICADRQRFWVPNPSVGPFGGGCSRASQGGGTPELRHRGWPPARHTGLTRGDRIHPAWLPQAKLQIPSGCSATSDPPRDPWCRALQWNHRDDASRHRNRLRRFGWP
jgi:Domain of unknown function (DUF222)